MTLNPLSNSDAHFCVIYSGTAKRDRAYYVALKKRFCKGNGNVVLVFTPFVKEEDYFGVTKSRSLP